MKVVICMLLAACVLAVSLGERCKEGEVTNDGCNNCVCRNGAQACTLKFCIPKSGNGAVRAKRQADCAAGETKFEDCNRCFCSNYGTWACTKKRCLGKRQVNECTPGDSKEEACNKCTCTEHRFWACTKRMCSPEEEQKPHIGLFNNESPRVKRDSAISEDLRDVPCAPNDFFKLDCNTCYCNLDRSGYLCTENICDKEETIAEYQSTTSIPLRKGSKLLVFNERHEILRRIDTNSEDIVSDLNLTEAISQQTPQSMLPLSNNEKKSTNEMGVFSTEADITISEPDSSEVRESVTYSTTDVTEYNISLETNSESNGEVPRTANYEEGVTTEALLNMTINPIPSAVNEGE